MSRFRCEERAMTDRQGGGAAVAGGAPPGGGAPDLASSPAEKKAAARAVERYIEPGTRRAGHRAAADTGAAVSAFGAKDGDGWATAKALDKALSAWGDQVKNLMDRLASEKAALLAGDAVLTGTDLAVGGRARQMSALDAF
jgi:hypothetical protein